MEQQALASYRRSLNVTEKHITQPFLSDQALNQQTPKLAEKESLQEVEA